MVQPRILFLASQLPEGTVSNDNAETLPAAFRDQGWQVESAPHQAIHRQPQGLCCHQTPLSRFDLVWSLGFGPRQGFWDRTQLLAALPRRKIINAPTGMALLHGKAAWPDLGSESHIANDPDTLISVLTNEPGEWVLKPLAGSFGQGVMRLTAEDADALESAMAARPGDYFMLQRFLPAIADGEIRTLLVGGQIIGSYLRVPSNRLHANLARHGSAHPATLNQRQADLVTRIAADLLAQDMGFAAVDLVGDTLMEVNVANPGGLGTMNELYGKDFGPALVEAAWAFSQSLNAQP